MKRDREDEEKAPRTWPIKSFLVIDAETLKPFPFFKSPKGTVYVGATAGRPYGVKIELYENHNATHALIGVDGIWIDGSFQVEKNKIDVLRFCNGNFIGQLCFAKALRTANNGVSWTGTMAMHFCHVSDLYIAEDTPNAAPSAVIGKTVPELQDGSKFFESPSLCSVLQNKIELTGIRRKVGKRSDLFQIRFRYDDVENIQLREGFVSISPEEALECIHFRDLTQKKVKEIE